jgi:beta-galactosidase/beta-glucuronidase
VATVKQKAIRVNAAGRMRITTQIAIPHEHLWSPDDPFLYTVELKTRGDNVATRFGMRELHFDTQTRKAYLNNRIFYMRGSNIALHRFFDDSLCRKQPWNAEWAHRLLVDIPRQFHWNTFRTHLWLVPGHWLDVADENGILIQYEMETWGVRSFWNKDTLRRVVGDWMRDSWNHPSVVIWDMCNESRSPMTGDIIREVRGLDLSHRPWDDGYNLPQGEDDPTEDHHYLKFFTKRERLRPGGRNITNRR